MADRFYAQTKIDHGEPDGERKVFEQDEPVTGLSSKTMKQLWEAGALYVKKSDDQVTNVDGNTPMPGDQPQRDPQQPAQPQPTQPTEPAHRQPSQPAEPRQPQH
jgi:hypothetical protein